MLILSPPTWREIEADLALPVGPYEAVQGRWVWKVIDKRTGRVRSTCGTKQEADRRADQLNRAEEALWSGC